MSIDKRERAAVNRVIEVLGDRATPPPRFDELEVALSGHSRRRVAAPMGVVAMVVGLLVVGALLLRSPGDDTIRQTTVAQPTTAAQPPTPAAMQDATPDPFVPPRFTEGDQVMYPVALLDGTRIAVWLPADAGFDASGYSQEAGLSAVDGDLPGVRVDVTACDGCLGEFSVELGHWTLTASGDALTSDVWRQYLERIGPGFTADGYLTLGGGVSVEPIDGPPALLTDGVQQVSLFSSRPCDGRAPDYRTAAGLTVTFYESSDRHQLCMPDQQLEVWVPSSFTEADLELVELELLQDGPLAGLARHDADLAPFTGPAQIGERIVTSAAKRDSGIVRGYRADTYEPIWTVSTGESSAFLLASSDDVAIVAGHFGPVLALDATGSALWQVELVGGGVAPGDSTVSADGRTLYLPTSYTQEGAFEAPGVRAIDMDTGTELWRRSLIAGTRLQPAVPTVTDSLVLVADTLSYLDSSYDDAVDPPSSWRVHALDRETGEIVWQYDFGERETGMHNRAILADDDTAYATGSNASIVALDLETGAERWRARSSSVNDMWIPLRLVGDILVSGSSCFSTSTGGRLTGIAGGERVMCPPGIHGVLPNGQGYFLASTPELLSSERPHISAGIIIDLDESEPPLMGRVVGITSFRWIKGTIETTASDNQVVITSAGWAMKIDIYDDVAEQLGEDAAAQVLAMIVPRPPQPGSDLPSFTLKPPLRWATDDEIPLQMVVEYPGFGVLRGCGRHAVTCSNDETLQVVPHAALTAPSEPWPGNEVTITPTGPDPAND